MSRLAISSRSNKIWMVTGLMVLCFAVFVSGVKRPHSQISPRAESEKSKALRERIAKLTETRDEAVEANEDTRENLAQLQNKYVENAKELQRIKMNINYALLQFDTAIMRQEATPMYISKRWGLLDFRRFEALYMQICDENPHVPCNSDDVETDFNNLVDRLVFSEEWPRQVKAQVMDEAAERELQNIEEQWGTEMRNLVVEAITDLEEYVRSNPDLDFSKRNNFFTPYNTGRKEIATYEDAAKYLSAVVKAVVHMANECVCEHDESMSEEEEEDHLMHEEGEHHLTHLDNNYHGEEIDWENLDYSSDEERHYDSEAIYYQHHGYA